MLVTFFSLRSFVSLSLSLCVLVRVPGTLVVKIEFFSWNVVHVYHRICDAACVLHRHYRVLVFVHTKNHCAVDVIHSIYTSYFHKKQHPYDNKQHIHFHWITIKSIGSHIYGAYKATYSTAHAIVHSKPLIESRARLLIILFLLNNRTKTLTQPNMPSTDCSTSRIPHKLMHTKHTRAQTSRLVQMLRTIQQQWVSEQMSECSMVWNRWLGDSIENCLPTFLSRLRKVAEKSWIMPIVFAFESLR